MGWFASRGRCGATGDPGARGELSSEQRAALPPRFEAVGETLASGSGTSSACEVAGAALARDGLSLAEALDQLAETSALVRGDEPTYYEVRALSVAWSEATLGYLHSLSCDDPLTGLASLAHLRSRVSEVYRGSAPAEHALVVVAAPEHEHDDVLTRSMRVARVGDTARTVFPGPETIGHVGAGRVVVLTGRDDRMARRVGLLREMVEARVWIEGLPETDAGAAALLDELTRV
ncbi:hypothetical protein GCM10023146_18990 [Nocardioides caricicola]